MTPNSKPKTKLDKLIPSGGAMLKRGGRKKDDPIAIEGDRCKAIQKQLRDDYYRRERNRKQRATRARRKTREGAKR